MLVLQQLILAHIAIKYTEGIFTFFLIKPFYFPALTATTNSTANKSFLYTPKAMTHHGISSVTCLCCILSIQKKNKYSFYRFRILYTSAIFIHLMGSDIKISYSILRLIESMIGFRPRQRNLRLVFRLFSLMPGLPSIRLK